MITWHEDALPIVLAMIAAAGVATPGIIAARRAGQAKTEATAGKEQSERNQEAVHVAVHQARSDIVAQMDTKNEGSTLGESVHRALDELGDLRNVTDGLVVQQAEARMAIDDQALRLQTHLEEVAPLTAAVKPLIAAAEKKKQRKGK